MREHDRILAEAAKRALAPIGFKRKGRSRLWFADRGHWMSLVEFQPSPWSKGSYLNVSPHWLWGLTDTLSFDRQVFEVRSFIEFDDAATFASLADEQAATAVRTSLELFEIYKDLPLTAQVLLDDQKGPPAGGWVGFNAGMASGLAGEYDVARRQLQATLQSFADWSGTFDATLVELIEATAEPSRFRRLAEQLITDRRRSVGLEPIELSGLPGGQAPTSQTL